MTTQMPIGGGFWLAEDAAASYLRMRAAGCPAGITDAGRTMARQAALYAHQGQPGWPAKADTPERSKHTRGLALDLPAGGPREWVRQHGQAYGWMPDRVPGEPWHLEYETNHDEYGGDDEMGAPQDVWGVIVDDPADAMPAAPASALLTGARWDAGQARFAAESARDGVTQLLAQLGALTKAVEALAAGQGLDPAAITAAARQGAADALKALQVTITAPGA